MSENLELFEDTIQIGKPYIYTGYGEITHNLIVFPIKTIGREAYITENTTVDINYLEPLPEKVEELYKAARGINIKVILMSRMKDIKITKIGQNTLEIKFGKVYIDQNIPTIIEWIEKYKKDTKYKLIKKFAQREKATLQKEEQHLIQEYNHTNTTIEIHYKELENYNKKLIEISDKIKSIKERINTIQDVDYAEFEQKLKSLEKHPQIKEIIFTSDNIIAKINAEIKHDGIEYKFGEYLIELNEDSFTIKKLYRGQEVTEEYIHPHITGSSVCLGNISRTIYRLIKNYDYDQAIVLLTNYLNSYNDADPYLRIERFQERFEGKLF